MTGRIVFGACVAAASLCACGQQVEEVALDRPAPAYGAPTLNGDTVTLASLRGAPVLLNVWATWCHPCQDEMPDLQRLQDEFGARGLRVVGVSIDQARAADDVRRFIEDYGIGFLVLHDASSTISHTFRTAGVPETFLIDADGVLRRRWIGQARADDMRPSIDSVFAAS